MVNREGGRGGGVDVLLSLGCDQRGIVVMARGLKLIYCKEQTGE